MLKCTTKAPYVGSNDWSTQIARIFFSKDQIFFRKDTHESNRKTVSFFEKTRYVAQMYTEMELNEDSVYRNGHSLNSIDSSNSNHISSSPYLKPTTVVDDVVVDTRETEKTKTEKVKLNQTTPAPSTPSTTTSWRNDYKTGNNIPKYTELRGVDERTME